MISKHQLNLIFLKNNCQKEKKLITKNLDVLAQKDNPTEKISIEIGKEKE